MAALASAILVVDDDRDVRETILEALRGEGFQSVGAESAEVALEMLPKVPRPCLVLLDNVMPGMGGEGFLRFMAGHAEAADFPVVLMSAGSRELTTTSLAVNVLRKPFDLDALLNLAAMRCQRRSTRWMSPGPMCSG